MSTHRFEDRAPWDMAIKATGGILDAHHHVAATYVRNPTSWQTLQNHVREKAQNGFVLVQGSLREVQPGGTRWLRSDPKLWWEMHSASIEQLQVVKESSQGSELILGALAKQGHFGNKTGSPGKRGPSVVEKRWRNAFPAEMAFLDQCQSLGVGPYDALDLWKSSHTKDNVLVESQELGDLLDMTDLR